MINIPVCFAINDGYSKHLTVAIASLLVNNSNINFDIFILSDGISDNNKDKILLLNKVFNNVSITFIKVDDSKLKNLKLNISHITIQTYYRYLIADILPNVDKVLYLDADLVINGSIYDYWNTDISNFYASGVSDLFIEESGYKYKIGFVKNDLYVNAGSMLFNLKKIRDDNKVLELINNTLKYAKNIEYQDQDIINITFKGMIKEVSSIYNFTSMYVKRNKSLKNKAIVVHYTGSIKPWTKGKKCKNSLKHLYKKYLNLTPYYKFDYVYEILKLLRIKY